MADNSNRIVVNLTTNNVVVNDTDNNQLTVVQPVTDLIQVNSPGPQGVAGTQGPAGPSVPFTNIGGDVFATTSSLQVSGSFLVSGSSTFTNIGPAIFSGSATITGATTMSSAVVTGNVQVLGTASINTLQINTTINSTGSNTLGDNANDTQTLYGSVIIPTGSLTVTGSLTMGGSIFTSGYIGYSNNSRYLQFNDADGLVRLQGFSGIRLMTYDTTGYTDVIKIDGNVTTRTIQVTGSLRTSGSITIQGPDRTIYTQAVTNVTADSYLYFGDSTRLGGTGGSNIHYASGYYSQAAHQFYGGTAAGMTSVVDIYGGQAGKPALRVSGSTQITGSLNVTGVYTTISDTVSSFVGGVVYIGSNFANVQGNLGVGSFGNPGARLNVKGSGTTSATTTLRVENNNTSASLVVLDNGYVGIGTASAAYNLDVNGTARVNGAMVFAQNSQINGSGNLSIGAFSIHSSFGYATFSTTTLLLTGATFTSTSGTQTGLSFTGGFTPTSGTATYSAYSILPTINQTGGANGITRGLYINPTLSSSADFRAIETTSGSISFNHGSTPLMFISSSGNVGIGTITPLVSLDIRTTNNSTITPLSVAPNDATTLLVGNTGTNGVLAFGQNNTGQGWIQGRSRLAGGSANPILLNPLGGNVLVGTTTDAGYKLDVSGSTRINGTINMSGSLTDFNLIDYSGSAYNTRFRLRDWNWNAAAGVSLDSTNVFLNVTGEVRTAGNYLIVGSSATSIGAGYPSATSTRLTVQGSGTTSATKTIHVRNNTPTDLLNILDNGQVAFTSPTMSLAVSQSAFSISPIISASNIVGGQYYGVSITPTFFQTTGSQTETAFRVAATFTSSNATATSGSNIIADFGSTSAGSQLTVTDVTSGSIYMVNDVSGIPIIEATSNWDVNMYDFPNKIFEKTGSQVNIYGTMRVSGSFILPLSQSVAPQTGSAYWSGSLLFIYDGTRYRSSSFA